MNHLSIDDQIKEEWNYKPYNSLSSYLKREYGEKLFKISLDGGFTCPNRDGSIGSGGCIFCSAGGSGEFATSFGANIKDDAPNEQNYSFLASQTEEQIYKAIFKFGTKNVGKKFIAYFQAFTNTYGPIPKLYQLYTSALSHPLVAGISIATRPDCLGEDVLKLLSQVRAEFPDKFLWIELGLQTIHEQTAQYIRRGYELSCFEKAMEDLHRLQIPVIVHVILGLPGESKKDMLDTICYLNRQQIFGIKLQLLHVLKGTDLARDYEKGLFDLLTRDEYLDILLTLIDHLNPEIVLHRVTGDGAPHLLIAPEWSKYKRDLLNTLHKRMREEGHRQGLLYSE